MCRVGWVRKKNTTVEDWATPLSLRAAWYSIPINAYVTAFLLRWVFFGLTNTQCYIRVYAPHCVSNIDLLITIL